MIANCPTCGTHYKHEAPLLPVRARCFRCDTTMDLARFRPYRIVAAAPPTREDLQRTESHLPIGLDHPALATTIARERWEDQDPLPPIPEMELRGAFDSAVPEASNGAILADRDAARSLEDAFDPAGPVVPPRASGVGATFALWLATGAIAGTGASWMLGGTTIDGVALGAVVGALAGWGWQKWTSSR